MSGKYRYSFSGSDARAFAYFDGLSHRINTLESLHTISFSTHEAKGQVRAMGFRGIRGITRSVRTIAGSMIFLVIEDHPLRQLMVDASQAPKDRTTGWSLDRHQMGMGSAFGKFSFENRLATMLPPFNMLMTYVSELGGHAVSGGQEDVYGPQRPANLKIDGAAMLLEGIELLDDGIVTSTNDIVSEVTYSFIARDLKPLSRNEFSGAVEPMEFRDILQEQRQQRLQYMVNGGLWAGATDDGLIIRNSSGDRVDESELSSSDVELIRALAGG